MQPTFFNEGYTPVRTDTRWRRWMKILGFYQSQVGADPANDPKRTDTLRMIQKKINRATQ